VIRAQFPSSKGWARCFLTGPDGGSSVGRTAWAYRSEKSFVGPARGGCWLRRLFPTATPAELQAAFPGQTYAAIERRAARFGVRRATFRAITPTGNDLIDSVRKRARSLNFSMSELDAEVGAKHYFCTGCRARPPAARALNVLDGAFRIEWRD
jgi:hypothetical protein